MASTPANLHRFEPFTKRIARLKIDPVHTVEKRKPSNNENDPLQSFFHAALEEWAELNLSRTFTDFLSQAGPLCESLPQLLHHADAVFEILVDHIGKRDELALEPLLSLLTHLAHDLGQGFERYFSRTVQLIAEIAATHEKAEVVEWCFTCLAWIFKYLSKLLVHDLRPLLDIMTPYLSSKKSYIVRFSAESLAFLLRKAAARFEKNRAHTPLCLAIEHLLDRLTQEDGCKTLGSYQMGVTSLCVESVRGIDGQLHSCAVPLVRCLLYRFFHPSKHERIWRAVESVLIALMHETKSAAFRPVLVDVLDVTMHFAMSKDVNQLALTLRLLLVVLATRRGSRVSSWADFIETFQAVVAAVQILNEDDYGFRAVVALFIASILQFAPMDQLLPFSQKLLDFAAERFSPQEFFTFSKICAELGKERFTDLVLPRLQQYISTHWSEDEVSLYYMLECLGQRQINFGGSGSAGSITCPADFGDFILGQLSMEGRVENGSTIEQLAGRLRFVKAACVFADSETTARVLDAYHNLLVGVLEDTDSDLDLRQRVILGWGFDSYLQITPSADQRLKELALLVPKTSAVRFRLPAFVHAVSRLFRKVPAVEGMESRLFNNIRHILLQNLLATSPDLKKGSLELLPALGGSNIKQWLIETTDLMLDILSIPYTPSEARKISMLLRRLPRQQKSVPPDSVFQDLIPFFCLGLLSRYYDQTRIEVCNVLAQVVQSTPTEESAVNVAIQWLQSPADLTQSSQHDPQAAKSLPSSPECSDVDQLALLCLSTMDDFRNSSERFRTTIQDAHRLETPRTPQNGRSLALQVLATVPASAERRSRLLVPIFLAAPFSRAQMHPEPSSDASTSSHTLSPDPDDHAWSLTDRKAMLALFGKFVNPRVLYRSSEVHEKLVDLLGNGNEDIRKLALLAILRWKDPVLSRYEAMLLPLAEGKSTTSDIGTLLVSEEENSIRPAERSSVLPVVLKLIFGIIVGRAGTSGSQDARRKSLLRVLLRLSEDEVSIFLDIALGKLRDAKVKEGHPTLMALEQVHVPEDQQYGFLRLLLSMLEIFQSGFAQYGQQVVDAVVFCVIQASRQNQTVVKQNNTAALSRSIRRTGFQCLVMLFEHCPDVNWPLYLRDLFADAISPRLDIFASETTQGISGLLCLFATWAHSSNQIGYLGEYDRRLPGVLWQTLAARSTPDEVKLFILNEIVLPWTGLSEAEPSVPNKAHDLLKTESDGLLTSLAALLERTPPKAILAAVTTVLPKVAPVAESPGSRQSILKLLTTLLCDDGLKLSPKVRGQLLLSVHSFLAVDDTLEQNLHLKLLAPISSLFNYFKDHASRQVLCEVLEQLSTSNRGLAHIARLCKDLNAMSSQRLEEIDYEKRLQAFQSIQILELDKVGSVCQPIIYNLLFFLRTSEDFTIRSNALECVKKLIIKALETGRPDLDSLIVSSIVPVAKKCMRHESELARADFVALLGLLVQHAGNNEELANMTPLLVGNDEEASFFSNILHIQQHRRLRAIRRLVSEVEKGLINTTNIVEIFIPLLEMFVYDTGTDESAQSAKGQSITAIGTLLEWIDWKHFKALFRRYKSDLDVTGSEQKATNRLLAHAADALLSANGPRREDSGPEEGRLISRLAESLPEKAIVEQELKLHFIPKLAELVHYKDEAEISFRLPIAVIAVRLITLLPPHEIPVVAAPVTLDIAQILRSRAQESRDAARKALCDVVLLLGPSSLQFMLKEMRTALTRGYQLHVVSYTLHAILVALVPQIKHGDLDYCGEALVSVIMDDIFGAVGQEKDNQDYTSSMKEVKSSKSFDSMELLARSISVLSVSKLVAPIQTLLSGTLTAKQVRQVDELLRRIGSGLSQNPSTNKRDVLTFAYQLIQSLYRQEEGSQVQAPTNDEKNRQRYLVQLSSASETTQSRSSALLHKLAKFALDLVRSTLQRSTEVLSVENLHGFLPIVGDALVEGQEDVKISALRLLSVIIKLPMPELEQNSPLYVSEAVKVVRISSSTNEEGAQAALKLIAAVLRERKSIKVKESDIAELLQRVAPDIEAPDRQGVTFNFIRAIMGRRIQLPEVYNLADKIGVMMITNQTKEARDVARGVFVHFLVEYPQSSSRWSKQQKFLMKNLQYEHPEGRQSVMEAINILIGKIKGQMAQELISAFYLPILLRIVNDDNETCRQLAGALLGRLFTLADRDHLNDMIEPLNNLIDQEENSALKKLSMQAYAILLDTDVSLTREEVNKIRSNIAKSLEATSVTDKDDWELRFQVLLLLLKLARSYPGKVLTQKQASLWSHVWTSLTHSNPWIQSTSADLTIQFFGQCISVRGSRLPLTCEHGLSMDSEGLLGILKASTRILRRTTGNEDLSAQMEQILLFLGQCLEENLLTIEVNQKPGDVGDFEEEDGAIAEGKTRGIPATQYLLDQLGRILRTETATLTSPALLPKKSSLRLLSNLIPILSVANLPNLQIKAILVSLQHMTDTNTIRPRSADPTFGAAYQNLVELAHTVMSRLQEKLGDAEYVRAVTEASKIMRERREDRRTKRRVERVAEPEKAARDKKRKTDRKKERRREIGRAHQKRRREVGMS
ncbi:uncharacterized protein A1O5_13067 [Cladophialophora psammophila CBS 110553]|uniref:Uncharacterized protein n=1 Tax=Cladophialophora psammophila CBS 110553 TaxID=1182543 RepID=W9VNK4_9EURO|nr:uncharacterized protein A1O5_13067 [Cladophialophora psammophila CBS 110553]EXJ53711.1 hypothetical protein A1O5_13067 [Cladophialophora psammophila CBS 110553]